MNLDRKTCLIGLIVAAVILTGCGVLGGSSPPGLTLSVDGETITSEAGTYCWGGLCADGSISAGYRYLRTTACGWAGDT